MWFVVGVCTLLSAVLYFADRHRHNAWIGENRTHKGQSYEIKLTRNKHQHIKKVRLGIPCPTGLEFCLKRETWWDALFKRLGLAQEQQLQHLRFDENIYVLSDDTRLSQALKRSPALAGKLESLFAQMSNSSLQTKRLWCMRQRLWIEAGFAGWQEKKEESLQGAVAEVLPVLTELAAVLTTTVTPASERRDYIVVKAFLLTGLSSGMAVNGLVQLLRLFFKGFPIMLDNLPLLAAAIVLAGLIQTVLLTLCFVWLDRSSRIQLVLLELLLIGNFGAFSTSYTALRDYNIGFDHAAGQKVAVHISERYSSKCGKRGRRVCYFLQLSGIEDYPGLFRVEVDQKVYAQLLTHEVAGLDIREGALQLRWVAGVGLPAESRGPTSPAN